VQIHAFSCEHFVYALRTISPFTTPGLLRSNCGLLLEKVPALADQELLWETSIGFRIICKHCPGEQVPLALQRK
jgi:hypothetical protein